MDAHGKAMLQEMRAADKLGIRDSEYWRADLRRRFSGGMNWYSDKSIYEKFEELMEGLATHK